MEEEEEEARWAGGAFENSPDPDELPLPKFLFGSPSDVATPVSAPAAPTYASITAAERKPTPKPTSSAAPAKRKPKK